MTEDTRHNGGSSGLPFERVSQEITFPTHKQVFVFTLLFVTCQTTLAALGRGQLRSLVGHGTTNRVSIQGAGASLSRSLTADVNVRSDNDSPGIAE